jgi:uncharacterized protein DUF3306
MRSKAGKEPLSLSRWSRRKLEAAAKSGPPSSVAPSAAHSAAAAPPSLPPIESLSFDSDFSVFLRPGVDAELKQAALKKLLRDPRFNVMDGLDTYIGDYTQADPIPPDVLADLLQRFGGPVETEQAPVAAATASPDVAEGRMPASAADGGENAILPRTHAESVEQGALTSPSVVSSESEPAPRETDGDVSRAGADTER